VGTVPDDYQTAAVAQELLKKWDLRPRVHTIRYAIPVAAQSLGVAAQTLTIPSGLPFIILECGFGSIRPYDQRICEIYELGTDQVKWITRPTIIQAFLSNQNAGGALGGLRYAEIAPNETLVALIRRIIAVDPLELYPGAALPSVADLGFIGWEKLEKGKGGPNVLRV